MAAQYYYLIAGLPAVALDESRPLLPFNEMMDDAMAQLLPDDKADLKLLLAQDEVSSRAGGVSPLLDGEMDAFLSNLVKAKNPFLQKAALFERRLRTVLAGLNGRRYKMSVENIVPGTDTVSEAVRKSGAPDFGLSAEFPWVNRLLALPADDPVESERRIDMLRWEEWETMVAFASFEAELFFAFVLKLKTAHRWKKLAPETGRAFLEKLSLETRSKLESLVSVD